MNKRKYKRHFKASNVKIEKGIEELIGKKHKKKKRF